MFRIHFSVGFGRTLAACALTSFAAAQGWAFDLTQALQSAREHDAQYRAATFELEGSKEARVQGRAALKPDLSIVGSANRNHLDQKFSTGRETSLGYDSNSVTLQLRQPLFNRDAVAVMRRGDAQSRLGEEVFETRSDELVFRLVESYSKVLLAQEQMRLAEAQVNALTEEAQASDRLFARGEGTRTDMLESKSGLGLAQALQIESKNAYDDALAGLRAVVGPSIGLETLKRLDTDKFDFEPLVPARLEEWRSLAREFNPEMAARRIAVEIAQQDLARADAGHYPRVDLIGALNRNRSDSVNTLNQRNSQASIGVQLQVPIYSGGRINSLQRQNIAAVAQAEAQFDFVTSDVNLKLQTQFTALYSGARRIAALQGALQSGTEQVEATRKSVAGGVRTRLEVLRAQQQVSQTARDLAKARFDHALAWLRLRSLAGQLQESNLAEVQQKLEAGLLPTPLNVVPSGSLRQIEAS